MGWSDINLILILV